MENKNSRIKVGSLEEYNQKIENLRNKLKLNQENFLQNQNNKKIFNSKNFFEKNSTKNPGFKDSNILDFKKFISKNKSNSYEKSNLNNANLISYNYKNGM